jgi:KaiC/GvpD/RAD55 family RecA-like ATPase
MMNLMKRVRTGVEGLDIMLRGGLIPKRPYIVSGPLGSGKTTLCIQFLLEGIKEGESVIMVALDEPPAEIKENIESIGWDVSKIRILDATPDVKAYSKTKSIKELATSFDVRDMESISMSKRGPKQRTLEVSIHSVYQMLRQEFRNYWEQRGKRYTRVVIDSMTALKIFGMRGFDPHITIQSFIRFLAELEATSLITTDIPNPTTLETDVYLARGEIRLYKWREGPEIKRGISIERYHGSVHDYKVRPLEITPRGLIVHNNEEITNMPTQHWLYHTINLMKGLEKDREKDKDKDKRLESMDMFTREKRLREKIYKGARTL